PRLAASAGKDRILAAVGAGAGGVEPRLFCLSGTAWRFAEVAIAVQSGAVALLFDVVHAVWTAQSQLAGKPLADGADAGHLLDDLRFRRREFPVLRRPESGDARGMSADDVQRAASHSLLRVHGRELWRGVLPA